MAARPDPERIPLAPLDSIARTLGDLPEVAAEWGRISVDERMSWSLDWGNEMAKLEILGRAATEGALPTVELARYESLLQDLSSAMPTIARLHLRRPSVPLPV